MTHETYRQLVAFFSLPAEEQSRSAILIEGERVTKEAWEFGTQFQEERAA